MNLLDRLYFYLWDKFLRFSIRVMDLLDEAAGFPLSGSQDREGEGE